MICECGDIPLSINAFCRHPTEIGVSDFTRVYGYFEEGIKGKFGFIELEFKGFLPGILKKV